MKLFEELNAEGYLDGLEVDKENIMAQIGLDEVRADTQFAYDNIFEATAEDCYDIAIKAVRYQEYIGEMLSRTQKKNKFAAADSEQVLNNVIAQNKGGKITESKAMAKGSPEYTDISKRIAALTAWEDYLERFIDVLEKYHYLAKKKLDEIYQNQRKSM